MYRGHRDPEVPIAVPADACTIYDSKTRGEMVEVVVPPEDVSGYARTDTWGSIMIEKDQVRATSPAMNLLFVNDGARIVSSVKDEEHKRALSQETLLPSEIIGRWLKYFRWQTFASGRDPATLGQTLNDNLNLPSERVYADFRATHMEITEYINRLPVIL